MSNQKKGKGGAPKVVNNVDDMYREIKKASPGFFGKDITKDEMKKYKDMSFEEYAAELDREMSGEYGRQKPLSKEQEKMLSDQIKEVTAIKTAKEVEEIKRMEMEASKSVKLINCDDVKLPTSLSQFSKNCKENMFFYFPKDLVRLFECHDFVLEVSDRYFSRYPYGTESFEYTEDNELIECDETTGISITAEIEYGNASGLSFAKAHYAGKDGDYIALYFKFVEMTEEARIREFKTNKHLIGVQEYADFSVGYDETLEDIAKIVLPGEEVDEPEPANRKREEAKLFNRKQTSKMKLDVNDLNKFVYRYLSVLVVFSIVQVPKEYLSKRECLIMNPVRLEGFRGNFEFLQFIVYGDD